MREFAESRRAFNPRSVWAVVGKEFLDNVRNRWIIAITAIFIILTLVISYFGAAMTESRTGFQGLADTVAGMLSLEALLVPILGLMLGYGAVVREKEQGSIQLLLSMPITRLETILGKFLGLAAVMLAAILLGLGVAGGIIMAFIGTEGWQDYVVFILGSMIFALAFLSVGLFLSTIAKRRSTAMGLAVFFWFLFVMIFDTILFVVWVATGGSLADILSGIYSFPDWYFTAGISNPYAAFGYFAMRAFDITVLFGFAIELPAYVSVGTATLSMALWAVVPLGLSIWRFQRQDL